MYKFMMITNYKYIENTKYGECYIVNGLLYHNIDNLVIGRQNYTMWVYKKNPMWSLIKKENIGKDLYITFAPNGHVLECEVK